jgi:hypothetical protein
MRICINRLKVFVDSVWVNNSTNWSCLTLPSSYLIGNVPPTFRSFTKFFTFRINGINLIFTNLLVNSLSNKSVTRMIMFAIIFVPDVTYRCFTRGDM